MSGPVMAVRTRPQRIQRQRTRGWRMPYGATYVGRPSMWGNPFKGPYAVDSFRAWMAGETTRHLRMALWMIRGQDLVCWCPPDQPCHADVLLELANR